MMLRKVVWVLVGLTTFYVIALMITTPTPSKDEAGILNRLIPGAWFQ